VPTAYPKAAPSEVMGLLVLLNDHKGEDDVARLADDLDLEIDEILPSLEFAQVLQLVSVADGRVGLTDVGRRLLNGTIRERKIVLRDQLRRTTLFRTLLSALESSPRQRLTDEEVNRLIEFTSAPADLVVQNIINWGRYVELFRYDPEGHELRPIRSGEASRTTGEARSPPASPGTPAGGRTSSRSRRMPPSPPPAESRSTAVASGLA